MKDFLVTVTLEIIKEVEADSKDEAIQAIEERLLEDQTLVMDNLGYEVEEA